MDMDLMRWEVAALLLLNILAGIGFVVNMKKTLELLHAKNLEIAPKKVWFLMIPGWNIIYHFIINKKVSQSLYNEFATNRWNTKPINATYNLGIVTGIFNILMLLPYTGGIFWFAFTVLFFAYWIGLFIVRQFLLVHARS